MFTEKCINFSSNFIPLILIHFFEHNLNYYWSFFISVKKLVKLLNSPHGVSRLIFLCPVLLGLLFGVLGTAQPNYNLFFISYSKVRSQIFKFSYSVIIFIFARIPAGFSFKRSTSFVFSVLSFIFLFFAI